MILRMPTEKDSLLTLNEAFFRLSRNQDFNTVIEWLELEKLRLSRENIRTEGIQIPWNQGALQALTDLLFYSGPDEATNVIKKLKR